MSTLAWIGVGIGVVVIAYGLLLLGLLLAGRGQHIRAVAGFIPDCLILVRRLLGDSRVPAKRKWLSGLLLYLALPIDLVPDFLPIVGQLDDVIVAVLVLRAVLRGGGEALIREHWPGPLSSADLVVRAALR